VNAPEREGGMRCQQGMDDAAFLAERGEIERDLVRDTEEYLDELARGLTPSVRLGEAWDRFFRFGTSVIQGAIRARGLSGTDRDDCEQEFWAAVLSQLTQSRYEPARAGLRTWLTALARHKSADVIRHRTRHHPLHLDEIAVIEPPGREPDPATVFERKQDQSMVHRALATLSQLISDCSYQVLLLRSIEELDVTEVANALGLTLEQVRYRHCRAKQELRRRVEALMG
jgi:RNA polymerase sigma-70 factor, ECF subfamily